MSESTKEKPQKVTTQRLTYMAFACKQMWALLAAIELDLFSKIAEGANKLPQMAKSLELPQDAVDKLVTACVALELLEKRDDSYFNAPDVDRYLVRGRPSHYGDFLLWQAKTECEMWKDLGTAFRRPLSPVGLYHVVAMDANMARVFAIAGYNSSIAAGRKLAREFDFSPYSLFLDLGGGSGCYSIAAAEGCPNLRAIVFDFPNMCVVAEDFIAHAGLSDRIKTHAGDFTVDEFPRGADLVSSISNLHAYPPEEAERLIKKAFQAVAPGGAMIIIDYMLNDDRAGPVEAALRHLEGVASSSKRYVYSGAEISELMRRVGFVDTVVSEFIPGSLGRVTAKKPK